MTVIQTRALSCSVNAALQAHAAIEQEYRAAMRQAPAYQVLQELKETYRDLALDLAQEAGSCPRGSWGHHLTPDEVEVIPEGLYLGWDIDVDYATTVSLPAGMSFTAPD